MQVMPIALGVGECELFDEGSFRFQVLDHFFDRDIVIFNSRSFAVAFNPEMFQFYDKGRLMCLGSFGDGEGVTEFQFERPVLNLHTGKDSLLVILDLRLQILDFPQSNLQSAI